MLCGPSVRLNRTAITRKDFSENEHNAVVSSGAVKSWVSGKHSYAIVGRAEYGPGATSTTTKIIGSSKYWTDQPVDSSARREMETKINDIRRGFEELKREVEPIKERMNQLKDDRTAVSKAAVSNVCVLYCIYLP